MTGPVQTLRKLSEFEAKMAMFQLMLGAIGQGVGPLREENLRNAFRLLHERYPILGAKVVFNGTEFEFLAENDGAPAFSYVVGDPDDELKLEQCLPRDGRVCGMRVVTDGERFRMGMVFHHAVADGRAVSHYVFQYLVLYTALATEQSLQTEPPAPPPLSPTDMLAARGVSALTLPDFLRLSFEESIVALIERPHPKQHSPADDDGRGPDGGAPVRNALEYGGGVPLFSVGRLELSEEQTAQLRDLSHAHGLTMHSLVAAATVLGDLLLAPDDEELLVFLRSSVDARGRIDPPVEHPAMVTNFAGASVAVFTARRGEDPLSWANIVLEKLASDVEKDLITQSILLEDDLLAALQEARCLDGSDPSRIFITNIGAIPPVPLPDGATLTSVTHELAAAPLLPSLPIQGQTSNGERQYAVVTTRGRLSVNIYLIARPQEEADRIAASVEQAFVLLLASWQAKSW